MVYRLLNGHATNYDQLILVTACLFEKSSMIGYSPLLFLAILASSLTLQFANGDEMTAQDFLRREKGLMRFGRSDVWIVRDEQRMQRRLQGYSSMKATIQKVQNGLAVRIAENRTGWLQLTNVESELRALSSAKPLNAPRRRQLQRQRNILRQRFVKPSQLSGVPAVQSRLIELTNARNNLGLSIVWVRATMPKVAERYEQLNRDEETLDALRRLGGAHRLGPVFNFERVSRTLREYEEVAFTSTLPLYRQSGRLRLSGIINDDTPITFSWRDVGGRVVITSNMAQSAGIDMSSDAPRAELQFGTRRLTAVRVRIPYLRFGKHVFREVDAYVLPPEGEQLGAEIGRGVFRDVQIKLQPELLSAKIGNFD